MKNTELAVYQETLGNPEVHEINDLVEDCDMVIVTYGLDKNMKMCKVVSFFNNNDIQFEEVSASHGSMMKGSGMISLFRSFLYSFKNNLLKQLDISFWAVLLKDIPGFNFYGNDICDCRSKHDKQQQQWTR